jgi:hypothetical protein
VHSKAIVPFLQNLHALGPQCCRTIRWGRKRILQFVSDGIDHEGFEVLDDDAPEELRSREKLIHNQESKIAHLTTGNPIVNGSYPGHNFLNGFRNQTDSSCGCAARIDTDKNDGKTRGMSGTERGKKTLT